MAVVLGPKAAQALRTLWMTRTASGRAAARAAKALRRPVRFPSLMQMRIEIRETVRKSGSLTRMFLGKEHGTRNMDAWLKWLGEAVLEEIDRRGLLVEG